MERNPRGRARAGEDERPNQENIMETTPDRTRTEILNIGSTCSCGKTLKNERGLKIHRGKMGCAPNLRMTQRTGQPGEMEEEVVQDSNHSDHSVHVSDNEEGSQREEVTSGETDSQQTVEPRVQNAESTQRKARIKWPPSSKKAEWDKFDQDVDTILNTSLAGVVDRKIQGMATIMYNVGLDRFGAEEVKKQGEVTANKNRRQRKIANLRRDLRQLAKRFRAAEEEEKAKLSELRNMAMEKLKTSRRAERSRRRRKDRARARARFTANPFQFTSRLLGKRGSGVLRAGKEEVEQLLRDMHSDPRRNEDIGVNEKLIQPEEPEHLFDDAEPRLSEVNNVIRKARASSSPGPNGIPYKAYKNCPRLAMRLWKHLRVVWRRGKLADSWHQAEGCFIPKEENSETLKQFRTISMLNVEGKIFLAVLAKRMTTYMLDNQYIDIAVQKGGVPDVSGCIEHTSILSQIIREAKELKGELAVVWLDLANAYGSMPHKVVQMTLERYHVPEKIRLLLQRYFDRSS